MIWLNDWVTFIEFECIAYFCKCIDFLLYLGTGLHMLTEMLKYASPTHVIRLRTSVEGKNLPAGMFWLDEPEGDPAINLVEIRAAQHSPRQ